MQIKIFAIPIPGGDGINAEMNAFLRSQKVLQVESQLVSGPAGAFWVFSIRYLDAQSEEGRSRQKIDYRQVLDEASFKRFARMREARKQIATEEAIPPFAVFTDEELAAMAVMENLTPAAMNSIKGIGPKRVEKYGLQIAQVLAHEKDEQTHPAG